MTPLAIDLFCGLGGWTEGLLVEGWRVVGFDIERHEYWMPEIDHQTDSSKGTRPVEKRGWTQGCAVSLGMEGVNARPRTRLVEYPAQLVIQDVLTLHGKQFKDAALIVASPPCQEYSYMAMPWSKAKKLEHEYKTGVRDVKKLTALFDACFRIQREACEAAGHFIPLVVENVRGAQKWVGRSRWNFGSYHLWGDVPALMPMTKAAQKFNPDGTAHPPGSWFAIADSENRGSKNTGGSWFNIGSPGQKETNRNPVHELAGSKGIPHKPPGHWTNPDENGTKQGGDWFNADQPSISRMCGSKSKARKAASAMIARIPFPLARHIARVFHPRCFD